jgi:UDP-N-acetylmuramoyl-tripeptide--D-alanyl-D-alanine ligase
MFKSLKAQLTILQQEGYSIIRFLAWWIRHPLTFSISSKKPLIITPKARFIIRLSYIVLTVSLLFLFFYGLTYFTLIPIFVFLVSPFLYFFVALIVLWPYEKINRQRTIKIINRQITSHPHLTVIGVTGSYGKTSVKDFLFTILSGYQETLKTPESYNTIFGIAKVVDLELLSKSKYFICEMGAYIRGEITELCRMVPPKYAILTAIGSQHLERFKSLSNTTLAKFELIDAVKPSHALVNLDNSHIANRLSLLQYHGVQTYSITNPKADFFIKEYTFSPEGLNFVLIYQNKEYSYTPSLFGTSNLYNLTAAISMALILKVPKEIISRQVAKITSSPHRLELKKINQATLIDNAFSSNEDGFTSLISDLSKLPGKKVLITPGIVELGIRTVEVHQRIGGLASKVFDKFILVGKSIRTLSLEQGLNSSPAMAGLTPPISYIPNSTNLWPLIEELSQDYDWILLENDLPDNF